MAAQIHCTTVSFSKKKRKEKKIYDRTYFPKLRANRVESKQEKWGKEIKKYVEMGTGVVSKMGLLHRNEKGKMRKLQERWVVTCVVTWDEIGVTWDKKWAVTRDKGGGKNLQSKSQQKVQIRLKRLGFNIV